MYHIYAVHVIYQHSELEYLYFLILNFNKFLYFFFTSAFSLVYFEICRLAETDKYLISYYIKVDKC